MIVTSMIATLDDAMMPAVGPAAQASPATNVQSTSRAMNSRTWEPVR